MLDLQYPFLQLLLFSQLLTISHNPRISNQQKHKITKECSRNMAEPSFRFRSRWSAALDRAKSRRGVGRGRECVAGRTHFSCQGIGDLNATSSNIQELKACTESSTFFLPRKISNYASGKSDVPFLYIRLPCLNEDELT